VLCVRGVWNITRCVSRSLHRKTSRDEISSACGPVDALSALVWRTAHNGVLQTADNSSYFCNPKADFRSLQFAVAILHPPILCLQDLFKYYPIRNYTGCTQKNGVVSIVFTIETAPFFCVHSVLSYLLLYYIFIFYYLYYILYYYIYYYIICNLWYFWVITRRRVVIIYRRFGDNVSVPSSRFEIPFPSCNLDSLMLGPTRCPETSVNNYTHDAV
jgi:hypothetical protein